MREMDLWEMARRHEQEIDALEAEVASVKSLLRRIENSMNGDGNRVLTLSPDTGTTSAAPRKEIRS